MLRFPRWRVAATSGLVALLVSCNEVAVELPTATTIAVSPASLNLFVGEAGAVSAQVLDQNGKVLLGAAVLWSSDKPEVATVSPFGAVTARTAGTATLTATHASVTATVGVTVAGAASLVVTPASAQMYPGFSQALVARAYGAQGQEIFPTVTWTSLNQGIAVVGASGAGQTVTARSQGSTSIIAEALGARDTVPVQVVQDVRALIDTLYFVRDTAAVDVGSPVALQLEYRAPDGNGTERCNGSFGTLPLAYRSNPMVATGFTVGGTSCRIGVTVVGPGATWLVASVNELRDSVWVVVTSLLGTFSVLPNDTATKAGDTLNYEATVVDSAGLASVANAVITFNVTAGGLSSRTVTADASGKATVRWYMPQSPIAPGPGGTAHTITFFPTLRNGVMGPSVPHVEAVVPNRATAFVFSTTAAATDTVASDTTVIGTNGTDLFVSSYDRFGNRRNMNTGGTTPATLTHTNADLADLRLFDVGNSLQIASFGYQTGTTNAIVTETSAADTIQVRIVAGPAIVYSPGTNLIIKGQISSAFIDSTLYNGARQTRFPVWTATRDTVGFMLQPATGGWVPYAVGANRAPGGTATPLVADTVSFASTYQFGYPVFKARSGTMGDVIFISDSAGGDQSNVYTVNRSTGTVTKVTGNNNRWVFYRGLSLKPDGSKVLATTFRISPTGTTPDSSVAANVFEIDLASGAATQITQNTDFTAANVINYVYAAYSPDGSKIYIERTDATGRHMLVYESGGFREFDVGGGGRYDPTFNPNDAAIIAYLDGGQIFFRRVTDAQAAEAAMRAGIATFSWSKR